jgi:hypothetical protein
MGKNSRRKWEERLRRLEEAITAQNNKPYDNQRWNLSWILPGLIAVLVAWASASASLPMVPQYALIVTGTALSLALLWVLTPKGSHWLLKGVFSAALVALTLFGVYWTFEFDRPILTPSIGGFIPQEFRGHWTYLFVETSIENRGKQSGYAEDWNLTLTLDGKPHVGTQFFSESIPKGAAEEPPIASQEFQPGKKVRGWLFFAFLDLPKVQSDPYFSCGSDLNGKAFLDLSVRDSKEKSAWNQHISIKKLADEACGPPIIRQ